MAPMWSRDSAMERRRPLMTSSDRGSDSDHGSASPLARGGPNGNHRRHLSSGGSSDDSSTDHDRDQPRNTSGLPVSFASNLNDAITGGGMVRVDSAKHIHEAMATIPGLHKRGKSLELPMTKRLAFRKCRSLTKRLPALLCMGLVVFLLCSAVFKPRGGNGAAETDQLNFGGPDDLTKIPRADPGGARTATRDAAQAGELHRQRAGARAGRSGAADAARRGARGVLGALRHRAISADTRDTSRATTTTTGEFWSRGLG